MYAIAHIAIHDALNAIDRRYEPYAYDAIPTSRRPSKPPSPRPPALHWNATLADLPSELFAPECGEAGMDVVEDAYTTALADDPRRRRQGERHRSSARRPPPRSSPQRTDDGANDRAARRHRHHEVGLPGEYQFTPGTPFAFAPQVGRSDPVRPPRQHPVRQRPAVPARRAAATPTTSTRSSGSVAADPATRHRAQDGRADRDRPVLGGELAARVEPHGPRHRRRPRTRQRGKRPGCSGCSTWA